MNKTIIDGIDVSKCEDYGKCSEVEKWKHQAELGSDTADRLSKELEDKNQEIEKLKAQIKNEKQALQIDIDNLNKACLDLSQENEELKHQIEDVDTLCSEKESLIDKYLQTIEAATQLAPFQDEYFKGLDTKAIAELAKKSQRLTSENRELEQKNEELKAQVDEWKENCNNNFELVAIRTKLLTDIAIKLGLNTAIIERKDVFDKIDKLQSKEQLSLNQSQVIITLRNNLNVNKQKNANLLQENEELKKQLDKYLNQEEEEIRQLNNDNKLDDILESIKKANEQLEKESKYKQALIEIEDYVRDNCDFDKSDKLISDTGAYDILEMIPYDIKQRNSNG
jgi:hypothetical protein